MRFDRPKCGFPFAVAFSWFYEWTPQGIKLESETAPDESVTRRTGRRLDRWIIAILALAVVLLLTDRFVLHKNPTASADRATAVNGEKSIAVLPFLNMTSDQQNEFFADGLAEEILNSLARIDGMRVIGRTSSFQFKGKTEDLRAIGEKLGAANVLEGSVRRDGDKARITAQLIRASDGIHLWSETYDRTLTDILAVQVFTSCRKGDGGKRGSSEVNRCSPLREPERRQRCRLFCRWNSG